MEIIGKPGEEVWVKAKIHLINITEDGTTYYVKLDETGPAFGKRAEDIIAAAPKIIREPAKREKPQEEPEDEPEEEPEEEPAPRRRGRPKKATVEGLMAKAEQARIRREAEEAPLWVENDT
jgi:hypothetical protein